MKPSLALVRHVAGIENLQRNEASKSLIASEINGPHASFAEDAKNLETDERRNGLRHHSQAFYTPGAIRRRETNVAAAL
jgi:hypothetical protein